MNMQTQLNQVSLEEASNLISQAIIAERSKLDETLSKLERDRKKFEEDYIIANDGDSSENAPLDEAKKNLRNNMGQIVATMSLIQQMDNIELVDFILGTYDFSTIGRFYESLSGVDKDTVNTTFGCNSESTLINYIRNSNLDEFFSRCEKLHEMVINDGTEEIIAFLNVILEFLNERSKPAYNYSGIVTLYSTVRLDYNGEIYTYRIYPDNISFLDIGVLASNSRVATAILGKTKGDFVTLEHNTKRNILECKILDIY